MTKKIIAIDLYCGLGGATQGMIDAGVEVVLSIDLWEVAEYLHKLNYPDVKFVRRALGEDPEADLILFEEVLKEWRENPDAIHFHLHGSPPCQAFSNIKGNKGRPISEGKKHIDYFLSLVETLKPNSWSMENVATVKSHYPHLSFQMLKAMDFGVPQRRNRFIAGEGWHVEVPKDRKIVAWNDVIDSKGATALNTVGCSVSTSPRSTFSDSALGQVSKTITRQRPSLRRLNDDGTYTLMGHVDEYDTAKLFGFPDGMNFDKGDFTQTDIRIAIGNCVCPPVMTAVIKGIKS